MDAVRKRSCLGQRAGCHPNLPHAESTLSAAVPPIRRTTLLAVVSLGLVVAAVVAGYVGFMATIGGTGSHEQAIDACAATPSTRSIANRAGGISVRDSWRWWLPGHSHACVYEMKDGTKVVRPVSAGYRSEER